MEARLFTGENLSFDLLVPAAEKPDTITGFFSRVANDLFHFEPFPGETRTLEFKRESEIDNSEILETDSEFDFSKNDFGLSATVAAGNGRQVFLVPRSNSRHRPRLVWHLDLTRPSDKPLVVIRNTARNFWFIPEDNSGMVNIDLLERTIDGQSIGIGGGFLTPTIGRGYAHKLLFRLISASSPTLKIKPKVEGTSLALYFDFHRRMRATFYLFPAVDRSHMFMGGTPTASSTRSSTVVAVGSPLTPRFMRALASAAAGPNGLPVSKRPAMGNPNPTCPLLTFINNDQIFIPAIGQRHNALLKSTISELIFVGDIPKAITEVWKNLANLDFIGLVTESESTARAFVGTDPKTFFVHDHNCLMSSDAKLGALVVQNILLSWSGIETFFDGIRERKPQQYSADLAEGLREHFDNRLPPLPACIDLEVSAIVQLTNSQRGRVTVDDGKDVVDYLPLTQSQNWIFNNEPFSFNDRKSLKAELSIRAAVEYMAVRAFFDYKSCLEDGVFQLETGPRINKENALSDFAAVWQRGPSANVQKFREAVAALKVHYRHSTNAEEVLRDIATIFLRRTLSRRDIKTSVDRLGSWLNPLSIILTRGPSDSVHDPFVELGIMNWVSFASGLSANKPAAVSVSIRKEEELKSPLRRQSRIHRSIRLLPHTPQSIEHYTIKRARAVLGAEIRGLISEEVFDLIRCLDADRLVYHSPLYLDFVPIHSTILGVEYPTVRYPADETLLDGFILPNVAAVAQNLLVEADNVCVARSKSEDAAENWSEKVVELIRQLCPLLGISKSSVIEPNNGAELGSAIATSNLVFLIGHASAEEGGQFSVGKTVVSFQELERYDWEGKIVFLIGCETAAAENGSIDLSSALVRKGTQAIFGTSSRISIEVADVFLSRLLDVALEGTPLDYAFFTARREAVIFETLSALGRDVSKAAKAAREVLDSSRAEEYFSEIIEKAGLKWGEVYLHSVYGLSLTMTGGVGLRLR